MCVCVLMREHVRMDELGARPDSQSESAEASMNLLEKCQVRSDILVFVWYRLDSGRNELSNFQSVSWYSTDQPGYSDRLAIGHRLTRHHSANWPGSLAAGK